MSNQTKTNPNKFGFLKTVKLDNLGDAHKDDYLKFHEVTFREATELAEAQQDADKSREDLNAAEADEKKRKDNMEATRHLIDLLKDKFVSGEVFNEETEQRVEVNVNDLESLPMRAVTKAAKELSGGADENLGEQ